MDADAGKCRDMECKNNNKNNNKKYNKLLSRWEIKCKNYELCESTFPFVNGHPPKDWVLCIGCDIMFGAWKGGRGILEISDNVECPVCLEVKRGVSQPKCGHMACIDCFKRCWYGDDNSENEPRFPYPEIEEEYSWSPDDPKWADEYPLIEIYNLTWDKWNDDKEEKYKTETNLRKCPVCRR